MLDVKHSAWFIKLLYIVLPINKTVNVSTDQMPFMIVLGYEAKLPIDLAFGSSAFRTSQKSVHKVSELVRQAREIISKAKDA